MRIQQVNIYKKLIRNISASIIHVRKINEVKDPVQTFPVGEGRAKR